MGKLLREQGDCLNCGEHVADRYCGNCGQENILPEKSFHHLFTHFVEDLVHYDSSFRKTVSSLLLRPGNLTMEYYAGRRKKFVAPVKLYIFINFLTFFLLSILVSPSNSKVTPVSTRNNVSTDTIPSYTTENGLKLGVYTTVRELDSAQAAVAPSERMGKLQYSIFRKIAVMLENNTRAEFGEKFMSALLSNLPKVLFVYMPFFAFLLWLFHKKKRWFYFDHGIFTLHYFSFLLFTFSVYLIVDSLLSLLPDWISWISGLLFILMLAWWLFYFFRSHHRFYNESATVSRLKSSALFVINIFLMLIILVAAIIYTLISIK